jgi:hypothetical protein
VHARPMTTAVQIVLATDWRIFAWNAVQQTSRREAGVRISVLTTHYRHRRRENRIMWVTQRTFVREGDPSSNKKSHLPKSNSSSRLLAVCHLTSPMPKPRALSVIASPEEPRRANGRPSEARKQQA